MGYDRGQAVAYAHRWAYDRNPKFYNFDQIGGDCTNFISQCLYAGCKVMNNTPVYGWYYHSLNARTPSWSGAPFLYNFLISNRHAGPYGHDAAIVKGQPGDVIQLTFNGSVYSHSLIIVETGTVPQPDNILVAAHTYDTDHRVLRSYPFVSYRLIHIDGARK